MPKYYVSVEYRMLVEAPDENLAAVAAQMLVPEDSDFSRVGEITTDIIAITEED